MTRFRVTDHYGNKRTMTREELDRAIDRHQVWDWKRIPNRKPKVGMMVRGS